MNEPRNATETSGADQFDPFHPRRQFSWKVFVVAVVLIGGVYLYIPDFSDIGFGIAMAICGVVAAAIAAPGAFSRSWLTATMPDVAEVLDRVDGEGPTSEASASKSKESDAA